MYILVCCNLACDNAVSKRHIYNDLETSLVLAVARLLKFYNRPKNN